MIADDETDGDGGGDIATQVEIELRVSGDNRFVPADAGNGATGNYAINSVSNSR